MGKGREEGKNVTNLGNDDYIDLADGPSEEYRFYHGSMESHRRGVTQSDVHSRKISVD